MAVIEEGANHSPPGTSQVEDLEPGIIADPCNQFSIKPNADRVVILATARIERVVRTNCGRKLRLQFGDFQDAGFDRGEVVPAALIAQEALELLEPPGVEPERIE